MVFLWKNCVKVENPVEKWSKLQQNEEINKLPIAPFLDDICSQIKNSPSHFLILTAETAAGKSTALPVALIEHFEGKILVLEPRRLSVLNIASRISVLLGETCGKTCGYQIHLEKQISEQTRCTVITEAILIRMLQKDPLLEGINVVVLDEFHERSIHSDLALAFLKEAMQMRDDLFVVVMSATIETERLSEYLGNCPVYKVPGRQFPVSVEYRPEYSVTEAVCRELEKCKRTAGAGKNQSEKNNAERDGKNSSEGGSILVFLPGIAEIRRTKKELEDEGCNEEILLLHSSIDFNEQKKVFTPGKNNLPRIILSSAIAETSISVPDVNCVIDSGEARINLFNVNAGMETLVTRRESEFNAEQRKGRAGRFGPGKCIRLWNENEKLVPETPPEIFRADLTQLVLECFEWGISGYEQIEWLDTPGENAWKKAENLLRELECIGEKTITEKGKAVLSLGISVRLGCVALSSVSKAVEYSEYAESNPQIKKKFADDLERRVMLAEKKFHHHQKNQNESYALLEGYPDRIGKLQEHGEKDEAVYQFPSGRKAVLSDSAQNFAGYIIAPVVNAGERTGKILVYEKLNADDALEWLTKKASVYTKVFFAENEGGSGGEGISGRLKKIEYTAYGKIILKEKKIPAGSEDFGEAVCTLIRDKGIGALKLNDNTKKFLLKVRFYLEHQDEADKNRVEIGKRFAGLEENPEEWLIPFLGGSNSLSAEKIHNALFWYLCGDEVCKNVPDELKLENGKKRRVVYDEVNGKIIPVLEIIIQHIFGCMKTPTILGKKVLLKMLSPARRPLQITDDLEGFWSNTWPEICKEMKGRYPKHNWDYRVITED